jgi:hypothetical protein
MGLFNRIIGRRTIQPSPTTEAVIEVREDAEASGDGDLFEISIVGESFCQEDLQRIAGPKDADGKHHSCGVTLRCEPTNTYDVNAIRAEVMGLLLGHVARDTAARLSLAMQARCRGAIEARGMIVGGWKDGESEGHYGVRVWLTTADALRLGVDPSDIEVRDHDEPSIQYPVLPAPLVGELRLSPDSSQLSELTTVTVTHEEHYQPAISARRPSHWLHGRWPVLVGLDLAMDPHRKNDSECVRVHIDGDTVGFLTPAMTKRHGGRIHEGLEAGLAPTAEADVYRDQRKDPQTWQLTLFMTMPSEQD